MVFKKRRGAAMLELILVSIVISMLSIYSLNAQWERLVEVRDDAAASHLRVLTNALTRFFHDNGTCLLANSTSQTGCPFVANLQVNGPPTTIFEQGTDGISTFFNSKYLPPNFAGNSYRQGWAIQLAEIQPLGSNSSSLVGMIFTGSLKTNAGNQSSLVPGDSILPSSAARIVSLAGPTAGFMTTMSSIQGAYNQWSMSNYQSYINAFPSSLQQGYLFEGSQYHSTGTGNSTSLVSYVLADDGMQYGDWLARVSIPNHPEYNQMSTGLDMNSNMIGNVASVVFGQTGNMYGSVLGTTDGLQIFACTGCTETGGEISGASNTTLGGNLSLVANAVKISSSSATNTSSSPFLKASDGSLLIADGLAGAGSSAGSGGIYFDSKDVYFGRPQESTATNLGGTGYFDTNSSTIHAHALELSGPDQIFFNVSSVSTNSSIAGARQELSLEDILPRFRSVKNLMVNSGGTVPFPVCYGAGHPEIVTTLHGFENAMVQDSFNGAIDPVRTMPMRAIAYNQASSGGQYWQVNIEYLDPYSQCTGGNGGWTANPLVPNPETGTCTGLTDLGGNYNSTSNNYVLAQTFCYYSPVEGEMAPTATNVNTWSSDTNVIWDNSTSNSVYIDNNYSSINDDSGADGG